MGSAFKMEEIALGRNLASLGLPPAGGAVRRVGKRTLGRRVSPLRRATSWYPLVLVLLLTPPPLLAQEPGAGSQRPRQGVLVGARVGVDYFDDAPILGAQLHILPDPWGLFDIMPNVEASRHRGATNKQANIDLGVMPTRGFFVGAGAAWRNTLYEEEIGRETRIGYSLFVGIKGPAAPRRLSPQVEMRWTFVGDVVRPRTITVGANWPLLLWR